MKVLFLSGDGTPSALAMPNVWPTVATPFTPDILLAKVREVLDECPSRKHLNVILVVDHDEDRRNRTSKILTENGYAVLTANSVEQAEPLADTIATIDLIISGVVFSGHSGIHLAEHVEASQRKVSTLLVSHFDRDLLHKMPGFSRQPEFLPNPFTPEALLTRVRRLLDALP
jgi:DNA-binding response OmpR family regulator